MVVSIIASGSKCVNLSGGNSNGVDLSEFECHPPLVISPSGQVLSLSVAIAHQRTVSTYLQVAISSRAARELTRLLFGYTSSIALVSMWWSSPNIGHRYLFS